MVWRSLLLLALCGAFAHQAASGQGTSAQPDAARLYHDYCSVCHGDKGDGSSRAAADLRPRPRDFTAPQAATELTRERLIISIREGRPRTAMVAWKSQLSQAQIVALADYIRERFMVPTAYDASHEGRRIYAEYCSVCHGDRGNGQSRATASLQPPPRDFTSEAAGRDLNRQRMVFSITYGRPNTAMTGWETQLSAAQIESVVDYIRVSFMNEKPDRGRPDPQIATRRGGPVPIGRHVSGRRHAGPGRDLEANFGAPFPGTLSGNRSNGEVLYLVNCVPCHGVEGDGRGPRAFFILPRPRDFTHPAVRASLNRPRLYEAIAKGVQGAEMPAWEKVLEPQQIADIGEFVLGRFIRPATKARTGR